MLSFFKKFKYWLQTYPKKKLISLSLIVLILAGAGFLVTRQILRAELAQPPTNVKPTNIISWDSQPQWNTWEKTGTVATTDGKLVLASTATPTVCNNNGVCDSGEDQTNCPGDCPSTPPSGPRVDIKANGSDGPVNLVPSTSFTLSWESSNTNSCSASGGWSGTKPTSGSASLSFNATTPSSVDYILTCTNASGASVTDKVTIVNTCPALTEPSPGHFCPPGAGSLYKGYCICTPSNYGPGKDANGCSACVPRCPERQYWNPLLSQCQTSDFTLATINNTLNKFSSLIKPARAATTYVSSGIAKFSVTQPDVMWVSSVSKTSGTSVKFQYSTTSYTADLKDSINLIPAEQRFNKTLYIVATLTTSNTAVTPEVDSLSVFYSRKPNKPTNIAPARGATVFGAAIDLEASAFSDPDQPYETHSQSEWAIRTIAAGYAGYAIQSCSNNPSLTRCAVNAVKQNDEYFWHVRYQDSNGTWSDWSEETKFIVNNSQAPQISLSFEPNTSVSERYARKGTQTEVWVRLSSRLSLATTAKIKFTSSLICSNQYSTSIGCNYPPTTPVVNFSPGGTFLTFTINLSPNILETIPPKSIQISFDGQPNYTAPGDPSAITLFVGEKPQEFNVTATAINNFGTISPAGARNYLAGATPAYQITPNAGYYIRDVILTDKKDNKTYYLTNPFAPNTAFTYTFPPLDRDWEIKAEFLPNETIIWEDKSMDHKWATGPNWSGNIAPRTDQSVFFNDFTKKNFKPTTLPNLQGLIEYILPDSAATKPCDIVAPAPALYVRNMTIENTYTAATKITATGNLTINGLYSQDGGYFVAPKVLVVFGFVKNAGTFDTNVNKGEVQFNVKGGPFKVAPNTAPNTQMYEFYNLTFTRAANQTLASMVKIDIPSGQVRVANELKFDNPSPAEYKVTGKGAFLVKGNVNFPDTIKGKINIGTALATPTTTPALIIRPSKDWRMLAKPSLVNNFSRVEFMAGTGANGKNTSTIYGNNSFGQLIVRYTNAPGKVIYFEKNKVQTADLFSIQGNATSKIFLRTYDSENPCIADPINNSCWGDYCPEPEPCYKPIQLDDPATPNLCIKPDNECLKSGKLCPYDTDDYEGAFCVVNCRSWFINAKTSSVQYADVSNSFNRNIDNPIKAHNSIDNCNNENWEFPS